jgi:hypothetical protein
MAALPQIPIIRRGQDYESLDQVELRDSRGQAPLALVGQANAGLLRRDLLRQAEGRAALAAIPTAELRICQRAGELFLHGDLPLGGDQPRQSAADYRRLLAASTGLPQTLVARNLDKLHFVLTHMDEIFRGLTLGLPPAVLDAGVGEQHGLLVSYLAQTEALGVVLPSNSPGVNSLWLPAIALKIPVWLKPGREEPWTPLRLIRALIAAGCPAAAFGFYPTDHEGAEALLRGCGRAIIFGDTQTVARYASTPAVQVHGPGFSKILLGDDVVDQWPDYLELLARSVADNGGRSCINASTIIVPRHGRALAEALATRLATLIPRAPDDPAAALAAFANPAVAEGIDRTLNADLATPGAVDCSLAARAGSPRRQSTEWGHFLLPTVIWCERPDHPLARREFLFPFVSVVEMPTAQALPWLGPTLVLSAITNDPALRARLLGLPQVDRLNLGALTTSSVRWDQPHEGNLFAFLYQRRAIQLA